MLSKHRVASAAARGIAAAMTVASVTAGAAVATAPPGSSSTRLLAVGDPVAEAVHVYELPSLELVGSLDGVAPQAHAGFLPLPDGTVLAIDEAGSRVVAIGIVDGAPAVVGEAAVPAPVSHIAVDPAATFAAVGSSDAEAPITLVDLDSWESTPVPLADTGEVGLALSGDPLTLYHRNDVLEQVEAYPVERLLAGDIEPSAVVATGPAGHGEAFDPASERLFLATDNGVEVVQTNGAQLESVTTYPWSTADRSGGRGYFQRLTFDGGHVVSYSADRAAPEGDWAAWGNDLWVANAATGEVTRTELGGGLVYRFALAESVALFFRIGGNGDEAIVVDLDASRSSFGDVAARIPLESLTGGPANGATPWDSETRATGITPDGALGFVSAGGDGLVSVIDVGDAAVTATIDTPTPLSGGGVLAVFGTADTFRDTIAR